MAVNPELNGSEAVRLNDLLYSGLHGIGEKEMDILTWRPPHGKVPEGWVERQCVHGNWLIKVWLSSSGFFECSYTNLTNNRRGRFNLESSDLRGACDEAGEKCLSRITEFEIAI